MAKKTISKKVVAKKAAKTEKDTVMAEEPVKHDKPRYCAEFRKTNACAKEECPFVHACEFCKATDHGKLVCPTKPEVKTLTCDVCEKEIRGEACYKSHLAGRKHMRALHPLTPEVCDVCQTTVAPNMMAPHLASKKHTKQVAGAAGAPDTECSVCSKTLASEAQLAAHLTGKKHLNKVKSAAAAAPEAKAAKPKQAQKAEKAKAQNETCDVCAKSININSLAAHLAGKSHKAKVRKASEVQETSATKKQKV